MTRYVYGRPPRSGEKKGPTLPRHIEIAMINNHIKKYGITKIKSGEYSEPDRYVRTRGWVRTEDGGFRIRRTKRLVKARKE